MRRAALLCSVVTMMTAGDHARAARPGPVPAPAYIYIDLGTLGGTYAEAFAINSSNQVVGYSNTADHQIHAFLWTAATGMIDLSTSGGAMSQAFAINDLGEVVGYAMFDGDQQHAFLWRPLVENGSTGSMDDLGTLPANNGQSSAAGIEPAPVSLGVPPRVVGWSSLRGQIDVTGAFLFPCSSPPPGTTLCDLSPAGLSSAQAISGAGTIVGICQYGTPSNPIRHACRLLPGEASAEDLGTLDSANRGNSEALAMNGERFVGWAATSAGVEHAFLFDGAMIDLGSLGAASRAHAINSKGVVVGRYTAARSGDRAFIWTPDAEGAQTGTMKDLNSLVRVGNVVLQQARGINDGGWIVGSAVKNRSYRPFVLMPTAP